jgi:hypothetical protein
MDLRAGEQRGAFIDLIERIGHDDSCARSAAVDHGLAESEERLAAAEHRQHLAVGIQRIERVPAAKPSCDRLAQCRRARGRGIIREAVDAGASQRFDDQRRRRMLRFADRKVDRSFRGIRRHAGHHRAEPLERIRLQPAQQGIHAEATFGRKRARL